MCVIERQDGKVGGGETMNLNEMDALRVSDLIWGFIKADADSGKSF